MTDHSKRSFALSGNKLESEQLDYWKRQLAGSPAFLALPTDRPRPPIQTFRGARHWLTLSAETTAALKDLCRRERVEDLIGYFLNTLVLRANLAGDPTFRELVQISRTTTLDALGRQDAPLEKLIDALQPERNQSYTPLFQVLFVLQNTPMPDAAMAELEVRASEIDNGTSKFDLTLSLAEAPNGLCGWIEYATDLFDADCIERLDGHLHSIIQQVIENPNAKLSELTLLTRAESHQLGVEWNRTEAPYRRDAIHTLFEEQAQRTPDRIAVEMDGETWTYAELNYRADRIAQRIEPGELVGICMERSLEMVAAVLGVLKAGAAYLPLDPSHPEERRAFVLQDAHRSGTCMDRRRRRSGLRRAACTRDGPCSSSSQSLIRSCTSWTSFSNWRRSAFPASSASAETASLKAIGIGRS